MSDVQMLPREFVDKLTYIELPGGHWMIGLPIGVDPGEVSPPCFVSVAYRNVGIQYGNGIITLAPTLPLPISEIVQMLTELKLSQFSPEPPISVVRTINNAVQFLCSVAGLPLPA